MTFALLCLRCLWLVQRFSAATIGKLQYPRGVCGIYGQRRASALSLMLLCWAPSVIASGGDKLLDIKVPSHPPRPRPLSRSWTWTASPGLRVLPPPPTATPCTQNPAVVLGCTDCHGGDVAVTRPQTPTTKAAARHTMAMNRASIAQPARPGTGPRPTSGGSTLCSTKAKGIHPLCESWRPARGALCLRILSP